MHTRIQMYMNIYTCTYLYLGIYIHVNMRVHMHIRIPSCKCRYMYMHLSTCIYMYMCTCMYTWEYAYAYACASVNVNTYLHAHIYLYSVHMQILDFAEHQCVCRTHQMSQVQLARLDLVLAHSPVTTNVTQESIHHKGMRIVAGFAQDTGTALLEVCPFHLRRELAPQCRHEAWTQERGHRHSGADCAVPLRPCQGPCEGVFPSCNSRCI